MIKLKVTHDLEQGRLSLGVAAIIMQEWQVQATPSLQEIEKSELGTSGIYQLSPEYEAKKLGGKLRPPMIVVPGKAADQPLIYQGRLLRAVQAKPEDDGIGIGLLNGGPLSSRGFPYGQFWEGKIEFLEAELDDATDEALNVLDSILDKYL